MIVDDDGPDNITFYREDIRNLSLPPESYDGLVSNYALHRFSEPMEGEKLLEEVLELVKPGGVFAIHDLFYDKKYFRDPDKIVRNLESRGFKKVRIYPTVDDEIITLKEARKGNLLGSGLLVGVK